MTMSFKLLSENNLLSAPKFILRNNTETWIIFLDNRNTGLHREEIQRNHEN